MKEEWCWISLGGWLGLTYYGLLQERSFIVACHITTAQQASVKLEPGIFSLARHEFMKCLTLCWTRLRHITTPFRKNIHNTQVLRQFYTLQPSWAVSKMNALKEVMFNKHMNAKGVSISSNGNFNKKIPNQPRVVPQSFPAQNFHSTLVIWTNLCTIYSSNESS